VIATGTLLDPRAHPLPHSLLLGNSLVPLLPDFLTVLVNCGP
jgi:hypothetical protein